jgi:Coenzyme PQQ synthesis protein D (PqqD)
VSTASFALADDVAWLDQESDGSVVVYATTLPDGPPIVLRDTGGVIFTAAAEGGSLESILGRVAELAGADPDDIRGDVTAFVDELVRLGLLVRR